MTFQTSAWAIDGSLVGSSLARRAQFASTNGTQGIVQAADLKVGELAVPGVGLLIEPGVGLVRNRYQSFVSETYTVSNPSAHTLTSGEMPGVNASATSWILAVVVGDPEFSQVGHPWMGADDPPDGQALSFDYVRPTLIQVANSSVTKLEVSYPALELARIDIPANTTTITNSMITDLRNLAQPRQSQEAFVSPGGAWGSQVRYIPAGSNFADWGRQEFSPEVFVPDWAARAIVIANVNGVRFKDTSSNITGRIRTQLGSVSGPETRFDYETDAGGGVKRDNLQTGGEYNVKPIAGTVAMLRVEGFQNAPGNPSTNQKLRLEGGSQVIFDVRFFEE